MSTYFVSDLHLDPDRPDTLTALAAFLERIGSHADALYVLGDLFEMWIGDDDHDPFTDAACAHLCAAARRHPVYLLHGNRDFLIGDGFAARSAVRLLADPTPVDVYGRRTLLSHGDALCTDDTAYMQARVLLRSPAWQQDMLARPIEARRTIGAALRARSRTENANKPEAIMDANPSAILALCSTHGVDLLVHGHTHRPAIHAHGALTRAVLGAWDPHGIVLRIDRDGQPELIDSNAA